MSADFLAYQAEMAAARALKAKQGTGLSTAFSGLSVTAKVSPPPESKEEKKKKNKTEKKPRTPSPVSSDTDSGSESDTPATNKKSSDDSSSSSTDEKTQEKVPETVDAGQDSDEEERERLRREFSQGGKSEQRQWPSASAPAREQYDDDMAQAVRASLQQPDTRKPTAASRKKASVNEESKSQDNESSDDDEGGGTPSGSTSRTFQVRRFENADFASQLELVKRIIGDPVSMAARMKVGANMKVTDARVDEYLAKLRIDTQKLIDTKFEKPALGNPMKAEPRPASVAEEPMDEGTSLPLPRAATAAEAPSKEAFEVMAWKTRMDKILVHGLDDPKNDQLIRESAKRVLGDASIQNYLEDHPLLRDELDAKWEAVRIKVETLY